ncbi:MAG: GNAT family N-acetyltransferase [Actinobacteria bacterium]|nr:GNAT family N-acetyltransferase [Actinomycetota bacterium]
MTAADDATLGNLNLFEFTREDTRWQVPHTIVEEGGVLLFAGSSDFPAYNNGVHRTDDGVPGTEVIRRAQQFFGERGRGFSVWTRNRPVDDDLRAAAEAGGIGVFSDSPQMICRARLDDRSLPDGVEIRAVVDDAGVRAFADVCAEAYTSLGAPADANRSHFEGPTALRGPHVHAALGYLDGTPVSGAMILMSHGIAGVYWVASVEAARGRGIAEAVTRHVTNLGFDLGAASVQLEASVMGEPIYRRMGYEELERREFRLAGPPA